MHLRIHSLARWFYLRRIPLIPNLIQAAMYLLFNCILPASVRIGAGTRVWHHGWCIAIHPNTEIGQDCNIYNQTEITSTKGDGADAPVRFIIGDRVNICTGAKIVCTEGTLTIGEGSVVAANAVVVSDIPPYSIAMGVPAQCRPMKRSEVIVSDQPVLVG
jgi:serine O-acetyltransferase